VTHIFRKKAQKQQNTKHSHRQRSVCRHTRSFLWCKYRLGQSGSIIVLVKVIITPTITKTPQMY